MISRVPFNFHFVISACIATLHLTWSWSNSKRSWLQLRLFNVCTRSCIVILNIEVLRCVFQDSSVRPLVQQWLRIFQVSLHRKLQWLYIEFPSLQFMNNEYGSTLPSSIDKLNFLQNFSQLSVFVVKSSKSCYSLFS